MIFNAELYLINHPLILPKEYPGSLCLYLVYQYQGRHQLYLENTIFKIERIIIVIINIIIVFMLHLSCI